jgi:DNA-directed RNA polymerase specialized sigma24 family protein
MISKRHASRWSLTGKALERLLDTLDPDRQRAAEQYEALRRRLDALFRFWGSDGEWELTDRTLDRVALKLDEGAPVHAAALPAYVRGVARLVFYESIRQREREQRGFENVAAAEAPDEDRDRALGMLDQCLNALDANERQLILDYYATQSGKTIDLRKRLAMQLGISAATLRIRAHRLRQRLETCVAAAMKRSAAIRHLAHKG